ncbi:hypothetical protein [Nocardioides acrostichi]|uniref:Uncharacterized protein n=1 Tax=Nocardioides acrostichi TaxID=2784339 RepID=A0A930UXT1_9ACTN|nr:hypothetical protein [Nocardioides acrostichi]MBF4160364.1 hypothetical protein [Nocardioides acrostichi]
MTSHHLVQDSDLPSAEAARRAHEFSRAADEQRRTLEARATPPAVRTDLGQPGGALVVAGGVFLLVSQSWAFPQTAAAHWPDVIAGLFSLAFVALGMVIAVCRASWAVSLLALGAAALGLVYGLTADTGTETVAMVVSSGIAALGGLMSLDRTGL